MKWPFPYSCPTTTSNVPSALSPPTPPHLLWGITTGTGGGVGLGCLVMYGLILGEGMIHHAHSCLTSRGTHGPQGNSDITRTPHLEGHTRPAGQQSGDITRTPHLEGHTRPAGQQSGDITRTPHLEGHTRPAGQQSGDITSRGTHGPQGNSRGILPRGAHTARRATVGGYYPYASPRGAHTLAHTLVQPTPLITQSQTTGGE